MGRKWTKEQRREQSRVQRERWQRERERASGQPQPPPRPMSSIQVECGVKVSMNDLARLSPAQLSAFMGGMASVVSASRDRTGGE